MAIYLKYNDNVKIDEVKIISLGKTKHTVVVEGHNFCCEVNLDELTADDPRIEIYELLEKMSMEKSRERAE